LDVDQYRLKPEVERCEIKETRNGRQRDFLEFNRGCGWLYLHRATTFMDFAGFEFEECDKPRSYPWGWALDYGGVVEIQPYDPDDTESTWVHAKYVLFRR